MIGAEYHIDAAAKNKVKFISDAPLEAFAGVTDKIDGYAAWQGDNKTDSSEFYCKLT